MKSNISNRGRGGSRRNMSRLPNSQIKSQIRSEIKKIEQENTEMKYKDTYVNVGVTSSSSINPITNIIQGDGQSERVGDDLCVKKIEMRLVGNYSFTSVVLLQDIFVNLRLIIFRWKVSTTVVSPTTGMILENQPSWNILSPYNYSLRKNYTILYDETFYLTGFYNGTTLNVVPTDTSIKLIQRIIYVNKKVTFVTNTVNGEGHIYYLLFSDSTTTPHPEVRVSFRTYYTDE